MSYYELTDKERMDIIDQVIDNEDIQSEIDEVVEQAKTAGYEHDELDYVVEEYILDEYEEDVDRLVNYYYNGGEQEWDKAYTEQQDAQEKYYASKYGNF